MLNLLYAYLPERRDPVPNNFLLWRQALHAGWVQNLLVGLGLIGCLWLAWLYFRPARLDKALSQPDQEKVIFSYAEKEG